MAWPHASRQPLAEVPAPSVSFLKNRPRANALHRLAGTTPLHSSKPPKPVKPKKKKRAPRRLEDLPAGLLKKFSDAEQFVGRIPEMERELLSRYPLLERALEIEKEFERADDDANLSGEATRRKKIYDDWVRQIGNNKYRAGVRKGVHMLDTYLELMGDSRYEPFIVDGLEGGWLPEDRPNLGI